MQKSGSYRTFIILTIILILTIIVSVLVGVANISILNTIKIILNKIPLVGKYIGLSNIEASHIAIIQDVRLPRVLLGFLIGSGLSTVGVAFQGMFKNPMADPFIVGTSSGAALGASVAIVLKLNKGFFGLGAISMFAFLGALLATLISYNIAIIKGRLPVTSLLLAGIAVSQFFTAIMSLIMTISTRDMNQIVFWTMGSLSAKGWVHVKAASLPVLLGSLIIYIFARDLNIILLGEESAQSMGIEVERVKKIILLVSVVITAFLVSTSGIIGFVGLIIPHMVRLIMGPDHRLIIPASSLLGGIFLIIADSLARTVIAPTELPVGIITALAGGPFFIYLLRKTKNNI